MLILEESGEQPKPQMTNARNLCTFIVWAKLSSCRSWQSSWHWAPILPMVRYSLLFPVVVVAVPPAQIVPPARFAVLPIVTALLF